MFVRNLQKTYKWIIDELQEYPDLFKFLLVLRGCYHFKNREFSQVSGSNNVALPVHS